MCFQLDFYICVFRQGTNYKKSSVNLFITHEALVYTLVSLSHLVHRVGATLYVTMVTCHHATFDSGAADCHHHFFKVENRIFLATMQKRSVA